MPESRWGMCKDCKWWQIEPDAAIEDLTLGLCIDEKLQAFQPASRLGKQRLQPLQGGHARASQRLRSRPSHRPANPLT
jgi:hypothetical protein